jgi:hypothetical protein
VTPERVVAGEPMALTLQPGGWARREFRLAVPHPWCGLAGSLNDVQVEAFADSEPAPACWERFEHGHGHAVARMDHAGEVRLTGLRAPTAAGPLRPVVLRGGKRVCEHLQLVVDPGAATALEQVGPTTAQPGRDVAVGLRLVDAGGNPRPGDGPWRLTGRCVDGLSRAGPAIALGRTPAPAPPPGVWIPVAEGGDRQATGNPLHVADDAPPESGADLHGHGALSDGWRDPDPWFAHARDVAFLDAAALSEHTWQLTADEWARLRAATDAASVPGRFAALHGLETNVVGHEVAFLRDPSLLDGGGVGPGATTIWEETDLGRRSAAVDPSPRRWASAEGVLSVPHTTLDPSMGADLPHRRLPGLRLVEVYSAHGSSVDRGGWRSMRDSDAEPRASVHELLRRGVPVGFLAAGDSHDGRPGTTRWGAVPGGLTAVRAAALTSEAIWDAMHARATVASSRRRVHAEATLAGQRVGRTSTPGVLRDRVADAAPPAAMHLVRDGVREQVPLSPAPGAWAEVPVRASFRSLHLEIELRDGERLWLSPWFAEGG